MIPILNFDSGAIEAAIAAAELRTSGEIRVCVERRSFPDLEARAREVFVKLGMTGTKERNGVLLYVHLRERCLIVLGDSGINDKVESDFWQRVRDAVLACFARKEMTVGIVLGIMLTAEQLAAFFPMGCGERCNQLPDAVVEGESL